MVDSIIPLNENRCYNSYWVALFHNNTSRTCASWLIIKVYTYKFRRVLSKVDTRSEATFLVVFKTNLIFCFPSFESLFWKENFSNNSLWIRSFLLLSQNFQKNITVNLWKPKILITDLYLIFHNESAQNLKMFYIIENKY